MSFNAKIQKSLLYLGDIVHPDMVFSASEILHEIQALRKQTTS